MDLWRGASGMKSYVENAIDQAQTELSKCFSTISYDRQVLLHIILSLMLDSGVYEYNLTVDEYDSLMNHGIAYSITPENVISIRVVFPEETKDIVGDEDE